MKLLMILGLALSVLRAAQAAEPVTFSFALSDDGRNPFAREIWAEVVTPSAATLRLPAYFAGDGQFAVRVRATEAGTYRLGTVFETANGMVAPLDIGRDLRRTRRVREAESLSAVRMERGPAARFLLADGEPYVPVGANLAWAPREPVAWYRGALRRFSEAGLNWTRIWMAHWGGLNLDWVTPDRGPAPAQGALDSRVADRWDMIIAEAERRGVYVQMVLQHHGQFSTHSNSNWKDNPWNAANPGGFLRSPAEFFTSARARELTRQKYRYIVARWGYSPAVLAWELFNEVHWVDALSIEHDVAAVAKWHDEMAAFIRSVDVYHHLVTTSTEDLGSPIYASMDYFQPHLYATNMLAASRRFDVSPAKLDRPVFYGEMGDDHMRLVPEQAAAGSELAPITWSSLMGEGGFPAQTWEGAKLLERGRIGELGAIARFVAGSGISRREGLREFSATMESEAKVPLVIEAGEMWRLRTPPVIEVSTDGRQSLAYATMPRIFVGSPKSVAEGYPDRATLRVNYPKAATAQVRLADGGKGGAAVRVRIDGAKVAEHAWPALPAKSNSATPARPAELSFPVGAGEHAIVIENTGREDWFDFESIDLGLETSALAAVGRRGDDFIALWIWQRSGVYALKAPAPVTGAVVLDEVRAGTWQVTWWNTLSGVAAAPVTVTHPGGRLKLPTPPVARHAAVVLVRTQD